MRSVIWSMTEEEEKRIPDIRRCERVPWPKPMIEHSMDSAISVWRNKRKRGTRVLIWLENFGLSGGDGGETEVDDTCNRLLHRRQISKAKADKGEGRLLQNAKAA